MRSNLNLLLILLITILGCARAVPVGGRVSESTIANVETLINKDTLSTCKGYPSKESCKNGDSTLFNGLLCLSEPGTEDPFKACESVKQSVDSNGRIWRAPSRVGIEGEDTASRDQFLGVMAYLVKTKDVELRKRIYNYLSSHSFQLCPTASDNRCQLTPAMLGLFHFVWKSVDNSKIPLPLLAGNIGDDSALMVSAEAAPLGYQLHLVAIQLFIRQKANAYSDKAHMASITVLRRQPQNPFFYYLQNGPSDKLGELVIASVEPNTKVPAGNADQWTWERDTKEKAQQDSMGWEYQFILNLLKEGH
jgi:hypothetical protein